MITAACAGEGGGPEWGRRFNFVLLFPKSSGTKDNVLDRRRKLYPYA
jgi:hypothetical protein